MTTYTIIPKPSQTAYTQVTFQGKQIYDDPSVLYDEASVFYDSYNPSQYTTVAKPSQTNYTTVAKPL